MRLLVVLDFRFTQTPDGRVWTRTTYSRSFWDRYLEVFDQVRVMARAEQVKQVDDRYNLVTGPEVEFVAVPYYLGPWQYLKVRGRVRRKIRSSVHRQDAVLC